MKAKIIFLLVLLISFVKSDAQTLEWKWGRGGGGASNDTGKVVTVDSKRNYVYVLGGTNSSSITIGTQTLTGPASTSYFIAKYDTAGNFKWAKRYTGYASGIECDTVTGAVYVTGTQTHFFLQKLDSLGAQQWLMGPTVTSTWPTRAYGSDLAVLSNGDIVLAGLWEHDYPTDVLHIGSFNLSNYHRRTRFMVKVSPSGNVLNAFLTGENIFIYFEYDGQDMRNIFKLEKDNLDNVFVAWNRKTAISMPNGGGCQSTVPNIGPPEPPYTIFSILRFNSALNQETLFCFSGSGNSCSPWFQDRWLNDLTRDRNGDIYVSFYHSYWNGAYGLGSGCTGSGIGLLRLPNGANVFDTIRREGMILPPISVFNGLVSHYTNEYPSGILRELDFEANQLIDSVALPFTSYDAISVPRTRRNLVTGKYIQNATVGPDVLPSLAGDNFVLGATENRCPPGPRNLRISKTPLLCGTDSLYVIAPAGFNYLWNTGASTKNIKVNTSGSFSAILSLPGCPDILTDTITVNAYPTPPIPVIITSGPTSFCVLDSVVLTGPAGYSYLWSNGETTQSIVVKTTSYLSLKITNPNGCSATSAQVTINANPIPQVPGITTSGGGNTMCQGSNMTIYAAGYPFNYLWSTGATTNSISVNTAGTYTVTISSPFGCGSPQSNSINIIVNPIPPAPVITAGGPTTFCQGGNVTLTGPPGFTQYQWYRNGSADGLQQTKVVTIAGNYTLRVGFGNNCLSPASSAIAVTVNPLPPVPVISVSGSNSFCVGSGRTLTAPAGYNYLWSTGATTQSIYVTTSGSYTVSITSPAGCGSTQTSAPVIITANPLPPVPVITPLGPTTFCVGDSVILSAPAGYSSYWWVNQSAGIAYTSTQNTFSVKTSYATTHLWYVEVYDVNGCYSRSANIFVTTVGTPSTPGISFTGSLNFCEGFGTAVFTAPLYPPGHTYLWSTGATTQSIVVTNGGSYTVTVSNGCSSSTSLPLSANGYALPVATITAGGPTSFCQGGSVTLTSSSPGSGGTRLWSNGSTSSSIVVNTSGAYTVTLTNVYGCSSTSVATNVTVNPLPPIPVITASGPLSFCSGGSVTLTAPAGYTYLWNNGATTQSINVNTTGFYHVTVISAANCTRLSADVFVNVLPVPGTPTITAGGPTTFCQGGSVVLTSSPGSAYLWSNGATSQSISVNTSGNYTVTVSNASGCSRTSVATNVTVNPTPAVPTITASGPVTFCQGGSVTLTAPGGFTYLWTNGATTQSININSTGNYSVTVTNGNGCSSVSAITTVTVNPLPAIPVITPGGPTTFCQGGSVTLSAPVGFTYLWSNGATTQTINVNTSGNYSVAVTNANNCSSASNVTVVTVNPLPAIPVITQTGNVLTSTAAAAYQWYFNGAIIAGATTQSYTYSVGGDYTVVVTNSFGCSATSQVLTAPRNEFVLLNNTERFYYDLFPNPVTTTLTIRYQLEQPHTVGIRLVNMNGRSIPVQNPVMRNAGSYTLNANAIAERIWPGLYFLEFTIDNKKATRKIIKF